MQTFLKKDLPNRGEVQNSFDLYEMEESTDFYKRSLSEGRELNPPIDIDDTIIVKDNDRELQIAGAIFILLGSSHLTRYNVEAYFEKQSHFKIDGKSSMYPLFEDDKPTGALSSPNANKLMVTMRDE